MKFRNFSLVLLWLVALGIALPLLGFGSFGGSAEAACTTPTTCSISVNYKEPSTSANVAAIDDLKQTNIKLTVGGVSMAPIVVPATAPTGGGLIAKVVIVPAPACRSTVVAGLVNAEDTFSLVGADVAASLTLDRSKDSGCEPGAVSNFTMN